MKKQNKIAFAIKSRRGKRDINQDALVCSYNYSNEFCAVVCDGVGSVKGSEYASNTVANTFADEFEKLEKVENINAWFKQTLDLAMSRVKTCSAVRNLPGISTTLALLVIAKRKFYCFNVGDTRVYKISNNDVLQVSYDHIYKNYLISLNADKETMKKYENKMFALTGFIDPTNPKYATWDLNSGDLKDKCMFLIATDGLYKVLSKYDIYQNTWKKKVLPLALRSTLLNNKALKKNSNDNVSNIVISVK